MHETCAECTKRGIHDPSSLHPFPSHESSNIPNSKDGEMYVRNDISSKPSKFPGQNILPLIKYHALDLINHISTSPTSGTTSKEEHLTSNTHLGSQFPLNTEKRGSGWSGCTESRNILPSAEIQYTSSGIKKEAPEEFPRSQNLVILRVTVCSWWRREIESNARLFFLARIFFVRSAKDWLPRYVRWHTCHFYLGTYLGVPRIAEMW